MIYEKNLNLHPKKMGNIHSVNLKITNIESSHWVKIGVQNLKIIESYSKNRGCRTVEHIYTCTRSYWEYLWEYPLP